MGPGDEMEDARRVGESSSSPSLDNHAIPHSQTNSLDDTREPPDDTDNRWLRTRYRTLIQSTEGANSHDFRRNILTIF